MQDGIIFSESIARNIAVDDSDIDKEKLLTEKNLKIALVLLGRNHAATLISFRTMW